MLSMAGVLSTGIASLVYERIGVVTGLSSLTGVNPSVCSGNWGSRTNSDPTVEGMNRGGNCSWCRFQIMSQTWTSKFRGLTVPTIVPGIHLALLPKLRTKTAWFGVNWGLLSRLSWKTLTFCFELVALSALNLILGCLFISNSEGGFPNAVGVAL